MKTFGGDNLGRNSFDTRHFCCECIHFTNAQKPIRIESLHAIKFRGILPRQLPLDWFRDAFKLAGDRLFRTGPSGSAVGIVACPHIVVDHAEYIRS